MDYKIEVDMCPHEWDNENRPYFWMITNGVCNNGFGWSETPEQAWKDALNYYINHVKSNLRGGETV